MRIVRQRRGDVQLSVASFQLSERESQKTVVQSCGTAKSVEVRSVVGFRRSGVGFG